MHLISLYSYCLYILGNIHEEGTVVAVHLYFNE